MGGIVAADTLLLLATEQPIQRNPAKDKDARSEASADDHAHVVEPGTFMFPHIQGVLAFDTPYLGIAPGVVSYGAEGHYRNAATAYNSFTEVAGLFGYGGKKGDAAASTANEQVKALPISSDAAATPSWQRWGKYAMFAGAAGAVAAGGAAALYSQRQNLTAGLSWVSSHLEFVGCLARTSELRHRLTGLASVQEDRGIECVNFYTCLGNGAGSLVENSGSGKTTFSQKIIRSKNRTFCSLPPEVEHDEQIDAPGLCWVRATNDKAPDEVNAHINMFLPKENPAFFALLGDACESVVTSIDQGWYNTSTGPVDEKNDKTSKAQTAPEDDFMDADDVVVVD